MSQIPPPVVPPYQPPQAGAPYGQTPQPYKSNGLAIASLVCGLIGCVPFVTSGLAVVFGILGLRKTRDPYVGGKGLAIAGLILGIIGVGGWTLFGGGMIALIKGTETQRVVVRQFITDVSAGNVDAAMAQTDGTIARPEVVTLVTTVQAWGAVADVTTTGFNITADRCEMAGIAKFANTSKTFEAILVKDGSGIWKVTGINFK